MKIPKSELESPGVLYRMGTGEEYQITYNAAKNRFTLWKRKGTDAEKLSTSADIHKLDAQIGWSKSSK